ncbi:MAG: hypothetical protein AB7U75_09980 [Hyphomicrobiaceae bacterium]
MGIERVHVCESELRRVLQAIHSAADPAEIAELYEAAKKSVTNALQGLEGKDRNDAGRGVVSMLLYLHLACRTKEADRQQMPRLLAVR